MIRKATLSDMDRILEIYAAAREFMAENGNPEQWTNGYPQPELLAEDLKKEQLYVCETENGLGAAFVFFVGDEPDYHEIREGAWLNDKPYGVLHRIAVAEYGKGLASICIQWCYDQCGNMRGDTHELNKSMQRLFEKNGYTKCGMITIADGTDRIAYQKA